MVQEKLEIICQDWLESERGWGTRPDGYSLHLTLGDRDNYVKNYWDKMPDSVPDEYSRPEGNPYKKEVDMVTYNEIKESNYGIRVFDIGG